ncbi:MAG: ribulose-phosphate 3-epimerase [Rikenellaceae bacterium]|nr:ribulose-phosphate 3-epimerase [Rikenellaceae bacterium]
MPHIISPSLLTADFTNLSQEIDMLNRSQAQWIHLDVMDGVFVPNISFGFPVIESVRKLTDKILDAHLMIVEPDRYIERFASAGVNVLTVQAEACIHLNRTIHRIKESRMKTGVALNPHTPLVMVEEVLDIADMILIMSVNPGFGGQTFISGSLDRISRLKKMIDDRQLSTLIQVDGGVALNNAKELLNAGCDVLVAGNAIFGNENPEQVISELYEL